MSKEMENNNEITTSVSEEAKNETQAKETEGTVIRSDDLLTYTDKTTDKQKKKFEKQEKKAKGRNNKRKGKAWIVILIAVVAFVGWIGFSIYSNVKKMGEKGTQVVVAEALKGDVEQKVSTSGTIESEESKIYFSPVGATIGELNVEAGQMVKKGDLLVSYDVSDLEEAVDDANLQARISNVTSDIAIKGINEAQNKAAKANADYEEAKKYVAHYNECVGQLQGQIAQAGKYKEELLTLQGEVAELEKKLAAKPESEKLQDKIKEKTKEMKSVQKKLDEYNLSDLNAALQTCSEDLAEYKALKAQYEAQKESDPTAGLQKEQQSLQKQVAANTKEDVVETLDKAKAGVVAEFDGIVSTVACAKGQTVMAGQELFTVLRSDAIHVTVGISKFDVEKVKIGQHAIATLNGKEYEAEVDKMSKIATANQSGAMTVETSIHILNPDDNIVLGLEGKVSIDTAKEEGVLLAPITSINYASDGNFCYVEKDGVLVKKMVEIGISNDEYTQIISGLDEGDRVVTEVTAEMTEGMTVTAMTQEEYDASMGAIAGMMPEGAAN